MKKIHLVILILALGAPAASPALAASHSDAPLAKQDPQTNITDVYAFIGVKYDNPAEKVLNVVVQVRPFCEPGDGVIYDRFADDAQYSIHITHPVTGVTMRRYDFEFSSVNSGFKNPNTILQYGLGTKAGPIENIGDNRQNYTQTYTVRRQISFLNRTIGSNLPIAPPNVGGRVTPAYNDLAGRAVSGAADLASLDTLTRQAIQSLPSGEAVFAGSRDDGFYADAPGIFDLLNARILDNNNNPADGLGQDGNGIDGFKGFNVLSFAIQIPVGHLSPAAYASPFFGQQTGVGVYASVSRRSVRILHPNGAVVNAGLWVQVNRMGNPLFNEVLVASKDKDRYNRTSPTGDGGVFATYAQNPELAGLINFVHGTSIPGTDRADLVAIFIPDVLRVSTTTDPVRLFGQSGFNRLGFIGGDTTSGVSSGFPNGRRLGDDVVDIALTALASGPTYSAITVVGDNVAANDIDYHQVFPYSATPHSGSNNRKDPNP